MTHVVRAALTPVLGHVPSPFNSSTMVWISGCWICGGWLMANSSTPFAVVSCTGSSPKDEKVSCPLVPHDLGDVHVAVAVEAPYAGPLHPRRVDPTAADRVLGAVEPRLVARKAADRRHQSQEVIQIVRPVRSQIQENAAVRDFGDNAPGQVVRVADNLLQNCCMFSETGRQIAVTHIKWNHAYTSPIMHCFVVAIRRDFPPCPLLPSTRQDVRRIHEYHPA